MVNVVIIKLEQNANCHRFQFPSSFLVVHGSHVVESPCRLALFWSNIQLNEMMRRSVSVVSFDWIQRMLLYLTDPDKIFCSGDSKKGWITLNECLCVLISKDPFVSHMKYMRLYGCPYLVWSWFTLSKPVSCASVPVWYSLELELIGNSSEIILSFAGCVTQFNVEIFSFQ